MSQQVPIVLTVDDEVGTEKLLGIVLQRMGYHQVSAVNGQEALEIVEAFNASEAPFSLIVLDLLMPVLNGFQFLEALRDKQISIPVIVFTASNRSDHHQRAMELGATTILVKPKPFLQIQAAIHKVLKPE